MRVARSSTAYIGCLLLRIFWRKKEFGGKVDNLVRATVHHVRPATYAHTNLNLHTRIVARVQHVAQRHCHLLSIISLASSQSIASPVIKRHHPQSPSSRSAPTLPPLHASSSTAHSTRKQCARASCAPQRVGGGNCSASYTVTVSRPPSSRTTSSVEAEEVGARGRL